MPYPLIYGALPDYDRQEFEETGLVTETVSYTPEQEIKVKKKHTTGDYGRSGQVQVWRGDLAIELKGGIIPDANGKVSGLAAASPGQSVTCVHFAAGVELDNSDAIPRHGYTRDPNMLLMVGAVKTELGDEIPSVTVPMTYFPTVSKDPVALA